MGQTLMASAKKKSTYPCVYHGGHLGRTDPPKHVRAILQRRIGHMFQRRKLDADKSRLAYAVLSLAVETL